MKVLKCNNKHMLVYLCLYICYLNDGTIKGIVGDRLRVVDINVDSNQSWANVYEVFYRELSPTDPEYNMVKMLML